MWIVDAGRQTRQTNKYQRTFLGQQCIIDKIVEKILIRKMCWYYLFFPMLEMTSFSRVVRIVSKLGCFKQYDILDKVKSRNSCVFV